MQQLLIIAHNLRSAHNVGSLLRTADGMGVSEVIFTGYTPFPPIALNDPRLPHEQLKIAKIIHKTALGAETSQAWRHEADVSLVIHQLQQRGFVVAALEQTPGSIPLPDYVTPDKLAIILGREAEGIEAEVLAQCAVAVEIPMFGQKESFNVVQAAAMVMYHWRLAQ